MNYKCYAILCNDYAPKNIFEKIYYKLWLMCGVSPSGVTQYISERRTSLFIKGFENGLKEYELKKAKIKI